MPRSLPLLPPVVDRGRAKTRINSEPDAIHTLSVSLPPIRSSPRGSRDEECGPLPGISSIMGANVATSTMRNLTIGADQSEQAFPTVRPGRRLSEATPRTFCSSPGREVGRQIEMDRTALQHHSPWASPRQTRLDSIGGTDLSLSRPSSPEAASTLSSSYSTIASGTSLSSILEDRRTCASPGPIQLPGFAQLNSTLPHLRSHSARSAFELSDLRTSLPSEEAASRGSLTRAHLRSPRSTPLPLSRPMSPAVSTGGSPLIHPLTRRLRTLKVATDEDHIMEQMPSKDIPSQSELPGDTVPVKFEPNVTPPPRSPASKGISLEDLSNLSWNASVTEREDMSCTPTRTVPEPWPQEASPETATATSPSTPIMRESPSPFASTLSPSTCESSPPTTESEEEDSKSGILKPDSESEETEAVGAGAKHRERLARRRANQVVFDPSKAQARSGPFMGFPHDITYMMPPPSVAQLAQQAEQLGFKLQPDPARRPELEARMAQRRQKIEELQREEQVDAAVIAVMSNTWNPNMSLGMMGMPEHAPAQPLHLGGFNSLPLGMLPQDTMDTSLTMPLLGPDPFLDYSSPSPSFQSEFSSGSYTGLPGLIAAPSPASSFSLASPPPMSLPSSITRMESFRTSQLMEPIGKDEAGPSSTNPSGPGTHKCESCGKTFRRPSGLKDHMNIHSGEKPYCCPLETCRKGFATRSNMIRHHNKTHPNRPKIGGVADISADIDDAADLGLGAEGESSLASSTGSLTAIATTSASAGGGSSSQGRFRVVQQNMSKAAAIEAGVGPMRGTKERRAGRRQSTTTAQLI